MNDVLNQIAKIDQRRWNAIKVLYTDKPWYSEMTYEEFLKYNENCIEEIEKDDWDFYEQIINLVDDLMKNKCRFRVLNNEVEGEINWIYFNHLKNLVLL